LGEKAGERGKKNGGLSLTLFSFIIIADKRFEINSHELIRDIVEIIEIDKSIHFFEMKIDVNFH
jgi:hypothetical protein